MLEVSERLPKAEGLCTAQRSANQTQWVEISIAPIESEHTDREGTPSPIQVFRPVENDSVRGKPWQDVVGNIVLPHGAVGVNKNNVSPAKHAYGPNNQRHKDRVDDEPQQHNDHPGNKKNNAWTSEESASKS